MEFITKDPQGAWHFEKDYILVSHGGDRLARINPKHIPDPMKLWQNKCESVNVSMSSQEGQQLRPINVVFKLWEHMNANLNK